LFDSGATHSFASNAFAYKLNKNHELLSSQLIISTPLGVEIISSMYYKGCEIKIREIRTLVDLRKLGEMEYDVILGMDWLSTYQAQVNCH